jgi:putative ubiquitin-RnfH superfamily antitoxin RatB of RatAB toxin-antitoxin module
VNTPPADRILVEVLLACPGKSVLRRSSLPRGATVLDAVQASGLSGSDTEEGVLLLGVFGRRVRSDEILRDGDRVEILRTLQADPKAARRARVREKRAAGRASKTR